MKGVFLHARNCSFLHFLVDVGCFQTMKSTRVDFLEVRFVVELRFTFVKNIFQSNLISITAGHTAVVSFCMNFRSIVYHVPSYPYVSTLVLPSIMYSHIPMYQPYVTFYPSVSSTFLMYRPIHTYQFLPNIWSVMYRLIPMYQPYVTSYPFVSSTFLMYRPIHTYQSLPNVPSYPYVSTFIL